MPEESIWRGRSSQWQNAGQYLVAALVVLLIIAMYLVVGSGLVPKMVNAFAPLILLLLALPAVMALSHYLQTRSKTYELTTERIKTTRGVFSKVTDTLELYRVKDIETRQPFLYRMAGLENVRLNTSDASSPFVVIDAIASTAGLADKIRNQVEIIRTQKRVRELDIE